MSDARLLGDVEGQAGWEATVREFAASLRDSLLWPGAPGYDGARRVWNGMIDRTPASSPSASTRPMCNAPWTSPARTVCWSPSEAAAITPPARQSVTAGS